MLHIRTGDSTFTVVETNQFKHLSHLSLVFRQGNDSVIKQFLAGRLAEYKASGEKKQLSLVFFFFFLCKKTIGLISGIFVACLFISQRLTTEHYQWWFLWGSSLSMVTCMKSCGGLYILWKGHYVMLTIWAGNKQLHFFFSLTHVAFEALNQWVASSLIWGNVFFFLWKPLRWQIKLRWRGIFYFHKHISESWVVVSQHIVEKNIIHSS